MNCKNVISAERAANLDLDGAAVRSAGVRQRRAASVTLVCRKLNSEPRTGVCIMETAGNANWAYFGPYLAAKQAANVFSMN
eukprot:6172676-Pleurochrysis_carterae.AAC.2